MQGGLREALCERRSVGICCHDPPHDEAVDPRLRPFHTVSPQRREADTALYGKIRLATRGKEDTRIKLSKPARKGTGPSLSGSKPSTTTVDSSLKCLSI